MEVSLQQWYISFFFKIHTLIFANIEREKLFSRVIWIILVDIYPGDGTQYVIVRLLWMETELVFLGRPQKCPFSLCLLQGVGVGWGVFLFQFVREITRGGDMWSYKTGLVQHILLTTYNTLSDTKSCFFMYDYKTKSQYKFRSQKL